MERPYRPWWRDVPYSLQHTLQFSFTLSGRSTRSEAITYLLLGGILAKLVSNWVFPSHFTSSGELDRHWAHWILDAAYFVPVPALLVRRFHDLDYSAWWASLTLIGAVGITVLNQFHDRPWWLNVAGFAVASLFIILTAVAPGTAGTNRFGADPRLSLSENPS